MLLKLKNGANGLKGGMRFGGRGGPFPSPLSSAPIRMHAPMCAHACARNPGFGPCMCSPAKMARLSPACSQESGPSCGQRPLPSPVSPLHSPLCVLLCPPLLLTHAGGHYLHCPVSWAGSGRAPRGLHRAPGSLEGMANKPVFRLKPRKEPKQPFPGSDGQPICVESAKDAVCLLISACPMRPSPFLHHLAFHPPSPC